MNPSAPPRPGDVTDRILDFLRSIGLPVRDGDAGGDAFLPGVRVDAGGLVVDRAHLRWPGDLLHEAGHLAVLPPSHRAAMSDALAGHDEVPHAGEMEATAWAYAATVALGLDPAVLFHAGGYHGRSADLVQTYALGVYPGAHGLVQAGMASTGEQARQRGEAPYPHMRRWLRE